LDSATERGAACFRVLIVEDYPPLRQALAAYLEVTPDIMVVATAQDGPQALQLLTEHQPDVLILDIGLPGMSGLQVAAEVRLRWPAVAIIALTGDLDPDRRRSLRALGVAAICTKPVGSTELVAAIRKVAPGPRLEQL
jgi:two-component system response regulator DesR